MARAKCRCGHTFPHNTHTHSRTHTSWVRGVGVARLGLDVTLITVQVEIVRAIDCASKCYTSHLSFFFPQQKASMPFREKKMLTLTHRDIFQKCLTTCGFSSLKIWIFLKTRFRRIKEHYNNDAVGLIVSSCCVTATNHLPNKCIIFPLYFNITVSNMSAASTVKELREERRVLIPQREGYGEINTGSSFWCL